MHSKSAAVYVDEAEIYVDVVGRSTPVQCGVESEGLTFRESMSHAFLQDSGGVPQPSSLSLS